MRSLKFKLLVIGFFLGGICMIFNSSLRQRIASPDRQETIRANLWLETASSTSQSLIVCSPPREFIMSQAGQFVEQLTTGIDQLQNFPFRPIFGVEVFDATTSLTDSTRERWKRHCRLRDIYQSKWVRDPGFRILYDVLASHGLADDLIRLSDVHDVVFSLSQAIDYASNC